MPVHQDGITININPVIFHIGSLEVQWHGLMIMLGIIAAVIIISPEARKKGIPQSFIYGVTIWAVIGGIIGARLFHIMDNFDLYRDHLWKIFEIQEGGLAAWGGLIGGTLATVIYVKCFNKQNINLSQFVDIAIPALIVAEIIGRIGCTINGDATGHTTSMPWGFIYTNPKAQALVPSHSLFNVPTHPYPIYEMIFNFFCLLFLLKIRKKLTVDGMLFWAYAGLYSIGRIWLTMFRKEPIVFLRMQEAQVVGIITLLISTIALIYLWRKKKATLKPESQPID
jgi:phosphatidylglycerol---prolipoprotein diacylglyceryl transferase